MGGGPFFLLFLFVAVAADRYDPFPEEAFVSGEIDILTWNTTSAAGMQSSALRDPRMKWPEAKVFVKFHSSISSAEKNMITHAMQEIQQKTCVRFHYSNDQTQDFVLLVKPNSHACNSFVGKTGGKQQINLGHGCYHRSVILHELMHVLGFIHEHNRSDRDQYVTIIRRNIKRGQEHNFDKRSAASLTLMDTPYSYDSVMHYEGNLFSKDNQSPTIVPKRKVKLGGGEGLSPIDVQRINKYYGCGTTSQPNEAGWGGRRSLKSFHGTWLRAYDSDWKVDMAPSPQEWEHWNIEDWGGKAVFKAIHSPNRFLRAHPDGRVDLVDRPQEWETWKPFKNSDGSWSFLSFHGRWLSANQDGSVTSVQNRDTWEHFWLPRW